MEEFICVFLNFGILWLAAASPQELCIRFLPVTVCVMAQKEWRGNSKIFGEEGLSRTFLMEMRLFLFTFYNINYHFMSSLAEISKFDPQVQVKFIFLLTSLAAFSGDRCLAIIRQILCWWQARLLLKRDIYWDGTKNHKD